MAISEGDLVNRIREAPINYALLKLVHHEVGNGLAVLSGYRQMLQQAISAQDQKSFPPTRDAWQDQNMRELGYLRAMHDREIRLNNLLEQLRKLSPGVTDEPLCQHFVRTDLVALLGLVIKQRMLLCPDCLLQVSMPAQPLFIMCNPFWLQVLLEHVFFNYPLTKQTDIVPAEIRLESLMGQEAKITLHLRGDLPGLPCEREKGLEPLIRQLEQDESEACLVLNHKILSEHGGHLWSEETGCLSLTLPLAEKP